MGAGIYIHIPFCLQKCNYCDFFSQPVDKEVLRREYTRALLQEIVFYGEKYGKEFKANTIFFGGGTPSLMEPELLERVLEELRKRFSISKMAEITAECNPATLSPEKLKEYKRIGINRLSIGAQSFDNEILKTLGRVHNAEDITETFKMARDAGFDNINLDLMFAVPGQGVRQWNNTLKKALELKPEHLSFYSLEICENTLFGILLEEGSLKETSEKTDRKMYANAINAMKKAGYEHYEISNAALPGKECRHNLKYWHFDQYLGLGASAHSFINGVRFSNVRDTEQYIMAMHNQDISRAWTLGSSDVFAADCVDSYHINTYRDNLGEYVFTALRTKEGVVLSDFEEKLKNEFWDVYGKERNEFEQFVRQGFAVSDKKHIALTRSGIDISNKIMSIFV